MKVTSAQQYIDYHVATFGNYYVSHISSAEADQFFDSIGVIAMERMQRLGWVTRMTLRLWKCSAPSHSRIDVI
jgi:hypothetical protein